MNSWRKSVKTDMELRLLAIELATRKIKIVKRPVEKFGKVIKHAVTKPCQKEIQN